MSIDSPLTLLKCNIKYPQHEEAFADSVTTFYAKEKYLDVIFICKSNACVQAHKIVLVSVSRLLRDLIRRNSGRDETIYVSLPDVESKILEILINFLYEGITKVNLEELASLKELMVLLDVNIVNAEIKPVVSIREGEVSLEKDVGGYTIEDLFNNKAEGLPLASEIRSITVEDFWKLQDAQNETLAPAAVYNPEDVTNGATPELNNLGFALRTDPSSAPIAQLSSLTNGIVKNFQETHGFPTEQEQRVLYTPTQVPVSDSAEKIPPVLGGVKIKQEVSDEVTGSEENQLLEQEKMQIGPDMPSYTGETDPISTPQFPLCTPPVIRAVHFEEFSAPALKNFMNPTQMQPVTNQTMNTPLNLVMSSTQPLGMLQPQSSDNGEAELINETQFPSCTLPVFRAVHFDEFTAPSSKNCMNSTQMQPVMKQNLNEPLNLVMSNPRRLPMLQSSQMSHSSDAAVIMCHWNKEKELVMENWYKKNQNPDEASCGLLSQILNIPIEAVTCWFEARRQKVNEADVLNSAGQKSGPMVMCNWNKEKQQILEEAFLLNNNPTQKTKEKLAGYVDVPVEVVTLWFNSRQALSKQGNFVNEPVVVNRDGVNEMNSEFSPETNGMVTRARKTTLNKQKRNSFTVKTLRVLENIFAVYKSPRMEVLEQLAEECHIPVVVLETWFQDRLAFHNQVLAGKTPTTEEASLPKSAKHISEGQVTGPGKSGPTSVGSMVSLMEKNQPFQPVSSSTKKNMGLTVLEVLDKVVEQCLQDKPRGVGSMVPLMKKYQPFQPVSSSTKKNNPQSGLSAFEVLNHVVEQCFLEKPRVPTRNPEDRWLPAEVRNAPFIHAKNFTGEGASQMTSHGLGGPMNQPFEKSGTMFTTGIAAPHVRYPSSSAVNFTPTKYGNAIISTQVKELPVYTSVIQNSRIPPSQVPNMQGNASTNTTPGEVFLQTVKDTLSKNMTPYMDSNLSSNQSSLSNNHIPISTDTKPDATKSAAVKKKDMMEPTQKTVKKAKKRKSGPSSVSSESTVTADERSNESQSNTQEEDPLKITPEDCVTSRPPKKKAKPAAVINESQIVVLERVYKNCPKPDSVAEEMLARNIGLTPKQVHDWFSKKREAPEEDNGSSYNRKFIYNKPKETPEVNKNDGLARQKEVTNIPAAPAPVSKNIGKSLLSEELKLPKQYFSQQVEKKLEEAYKKNPLPDMNAFKKFAEESGVPRKLVMKWFSQRLAKDSGDTKQETKELRSEEKKTLSRTVKTEEKEVPNNPTAPVRHTPRRACKDKPINFQEFDDYDDDEEDQKEGGIKKEFEVSNRTTSAAVHQGPKRRGRRPGSKKEECNESRIGHILSSLVNAENDEHASSGFHSEKNVNGLEKQQENGCQAMEGGERFDYEGSLHNNETIVHIKKETSPAGTLHINDIGEQFKITAGGSTSNLEASDKFSFDKKNLFSTLKTKEMSSGSLLYSLLMHSPSANTFDGVVGENNVACQDKEGILKCRYCGELFLHSAGLNAHEQIVHCHADFLNKDPLASPGSSSMFSSEAVVTSSVLDENVQRPANENIFHCRVCMKQFYNSEDLLSHEGKAHYHFVKEFKCDVCTMVYYTIEDLISHIKSHAEMGMYNCEACKLNFSMSCFMNHQRLYTVGNIQHN